MRGMGIWHGTDANERRFNGVRNGLVAIYLDGVRGVSPVRSDKAWKQVPPEEADRIISRARAFYVNLVEQKPPRAAKDWHAHKVKELDGLINKAAAVREGRTEQKMTDVDYAELSRSLARGREADRARSEDLRHGPRPQRGGRHHSTMLDPSVNGFWDLYEEELTTSVAKAPGDFQLDEPPENYARRIRKSFQKTAEVKGLGMISLHSNTFKRLARRLGISKFSQKALKAAYAARGGKS